MELVHHFDIPVGIDQAWEGLIDLAKIAPCFPGANLDKVEGDVFSGSVRVKLGPIQLTYAGQARFVEQDATAYRARIEATGSAPRSGSTATMTVTATATAAAPDRTSVELLTNLAITGRPAQFGRGVMVEVGNKLIGQFADCVSQQLVGRPDSDAEPADVSAPAPAGRADAVGGAQADTSLDLLSSAGLPALKRLAPVLAGLLAIVLIVRSVRARRCRAERAG